MGPAPPRTATSGRRRRWTIQPADRRCVSNLAASAALFRRRRVAVEDRANISARGVHPTVWLCLPGMTSNPCAGNLDATVLAPDGARSTEVFRPAANPKIDCFYVPDAVGGCQHQRAAGGRPRCGSRHPRPGGPVRLALPVIRPRAPADHAAWPRVGAGRLADPTGRPRAGRAGPDLGLARLLGPRQRQPRGGADRALAGAGELIALISAEVVRNPAERALLVSAILPGGNLLVPAGRDVGGDFQTIAACRAPHPACLRGRLQHARRRAPQ